MIHILLFGLVLCMILVSVRMLLGPTIWDRLLTFNAISAKVILCIVCLSIFLEDVHILDISFTYALLGFSGTVLIARFIEGRDHL